MGLHFIENGPSSNGDKNMHEGQDQEKGEDLTHGGIHILPQYCKYSNQICTVFWV